MQNTLSSIVWFYALSVLPSVAFGQDAACENLILSATKKQTEFPEKNQLIQCLFSIQNAGFVYDEVECDYEKARQKIEIALLGWELLEDTLNQANLLKYLGYLKGRLRHYEEAHKLISRAIHLYRSQDAEYGVAVSWFNLSRVYEYQGQLDSAAYYTIRAKSFWITQHDSSRLIILNNNLIHLAGLPAQDQNIEELVSQNHALLDDSDIYWQSELDFYYVTSEYYMNRAEHEKSMHYGNLYKSRIDDLSKEIPTRRFSIYDDQNCR